MRALPPLSYETYAAEAFSLAALHAQGRLSAKSSTAVFRFWNPYLQPAFEEIADLTEEIRDKLDQIVGVKRARKGRSAKPRTVTTNRTRTAAQPAKTSSKDGERQRGGKKSTPARKPARNAAKKVTKKTTKKVDRKTPDPTKPAGKGSARKSTQTKKTPARRAAGTKATTKKTTTKRTPTTRTKKTTPRGSGARTK